MSIQEQLSNLPDPFAAQMWHECRFPGCAEWVNHKHGYCARHREQVTDKAREIHERARQMPPVPVIVDREEVETVDYLTPTKEKPADDPCDDPMAWRPVGPLETAYILAPPIVGCLFVAAAFGALCLGDLRLAVMNAVISVICLFAPAFCRWIAALCRHWAGFLPWMCGE